MKKPLTWSNLKFSECCIYCALFIHAYELNGDGIITYASLNTRAHTRAYYVRCVKLL